MSYFELGFWLGATISHALVFFAGYWFSDRDWRRSVEEAQL